MSRPAPGRHEVELAGGAVAPAQQLAVEHQPGAEAGADREEGEVVDAARHAAPLLAERREVDVVVDPDRDAEALLELGAEGAALHPGHVVGEVHVAGLRLDDAGDADHRAVDDRVGQARGGHQRVAQRGHGRQRGLRVGALHVVARAHRRRRGRTAPRAGSARRRRCRARAPPRRPARRRPRRSWARPGRGSPRAPARRPAATAARARRSAWRCPPGARSRRARSARRRGSPRGPCAR